MHKEPQIVAMALSLLDTAKRKPGPLTLELKGQNFLVDRVPHSSEVRMPIERVLRSMEEFHQTLERLNRVVLLIGLAASLSSQEG